MTSGQPPYSKKTMPFGCVITTIALAILIPLGLFLWFALSVRAYKNSWELHVTVYQRMAVQAAFQDAGDTGRFSRTYLEVYGFVMLFNDEALELDRLGLSASDIRFGNISVQDLYEDASRYPELEAEIQRLDPEVPRWETFGPTTFLVYDWQGQDRKDLPVSVIFPDQDNPIMCVAFEDGTANIFDTDQLQSLVVEPLASHNLPPLPDSFLSRLPR